MTTDDYRRALETAVREYESLRPASPGDRQPPRRDRADNRHALPALRPRADRADGPDRRVPARHARRRADDARRSTRPAARHRLRFVEIHNDLAAIHTIHAASLRPAADPLAHARQSHRRVADVRVLERRRVLERLALRAPRQPRGRRRGAGDDRSDRGDGRRPHQPAGPRHLRRRPRRRAGAHRPLHSLAASARRHPARARRTEGQHAASVGRPRHGAA